MFLFANSMGAKSEVMAKIKRVTSNASGGKGMRARLRRAFDRFTDIRQFTDDEAAKAINDDGIDILIDLTGFTEGSRTSILALRPAPIQVNYLGYPGTLGPELCDYIVTDAFCAPEDSTGDYSECFAVLPHSLSATWSPRRRRARAKSNPGWIAVTRLRVLLIQPGI